MRDILKDCLQEPAGTATDQFSIVRLNTLLNRGLLAIQMKVVRANPGAILAVDTFALVALKNIYPLPTGAIAIRKVTRTADGKRLAIRADGYMDVTYGATVGTAISTSVGVTFGTKPLDWSPFGRYMRFGPCPDTAVANGIAVTYIPSLTMAADTDVPEIVEGLHDAIVNKAWQLGLRPNADIEQKAAAGAALADSLQDFDILAGAPIDGAIQILPDFDMIDGLYGQAVPTLSETRQ